MTLTIQEIDKQLDELWDNRRDDSEKNQLAAQKLYSVSFDIGYDFGMFAASIIEGYAFTRLENFDVATEVLEHLRGALQDLPYSKWSMRYHLVYGSMYYRLAIYDLAFEQYMRSFEIAKELNDTRLIAQAEASLAMVYGILSEYDKAIQANLRLLDIDDELIDWHVKFQAYLNVAYDYIKTEQSDKAIEAAQLALEVAATDYTIAAAHNNLGAAHTIAGNFPQAKTHLEKAVEMRTALGNPRVLAIAMIDLADYYLAVNDETSAVELLLSALTTATSVDDIKNMSDCHQRLHTIFRERGDWEKALYHHEKFHNLDKALLNDRIHNRIRGIEVNHQLEKLRETNARQKQEFDALNIMKDSLLSSVSHDLKNPISVIELNIYLIKRSLKRDLRDNSPHIRYLDTIDYQLKRMEHLVTDVLDMARFDMGFIPERQPVDLTQLVTDACDEFQSQVDQKQITLTCQCDSDLKAHVDVMGIERVLTNLVSNAIKYAAESGHVAVTASVDEEMIVIQIKDDGIGIPEGDLPHIFERFYRVDAHQNVSEGTGLGLAIVKSIIEQHEGTIDVESQTDVGTTFTIKIPLK